MKHTLTPAEEKIIDKIVAEFNWGRVHKVMELINWEWYTVDGKPEVPQIGKLMIQGRKLLKQVCEEEFYVAGTGGLKATRYVEPDGTHTTALKLEFILAEWEEDEEEVEDD
jgi:hypothetical protein